jgi:predicted nucleic acid-binding protein
MSAKNVYLDTSTIIKRYLEEKGSQLVDDIYARAEVGALRISFLMWNVGELIGALDQHLRRKVISISIRRLSTGSMVPFL